LPIKDYAHPFERYHGKKYQWFSFCFNGNIANYIELKKKLIEKDKYHLKFNSDTEIIMHYISQEISFFDYTDRLPDLKYVFKNLAGSFDGAYTIAYLDAEGRLAAVRDPNGIRPLCYSKDDEKIAFASESIALKNIGCHDIRTINPGEILIVENNTVKIETYTSNTKKAHCMFEYIYFANVASTIEGSSVYETRCNLGKEIAKLETLDVNPEEYVVISVPDSSKPFGEGYAYALGLPHREGLVRNRFVGRTFIEGNGRQEKIGNKFSIIPEVTRGKKIILVDDSIIRGSTSKNLVKYIREE
jgi:amidophosphoribosyltransferase